MIDALILMKSDYHSFSAEQEQLSAYHAGFRLKFIEESIRIYDEHLSCSVISIRYSKTGRILRHAF